MPGKTRPSLRHKTLHNILLSNLSETDKKCIEDVFEKFETLNSADVEEVKHGGWKRVDRGTICTNCHRVYDDFEFSYKQIETYFKRCPECGAKMDGGAE